MQIAMEVIEVSAPELSIELGVSEPEAGWMLIKLIPWALARCPDHMPPSESDLVEGACAARKIAKAVGYTGDPEELVNACQRLRYSPLERVAGGIRIRGLDRYDSGWGSNHRDLWAEWRDFRAGVGPRPGETPRADTCESHVKNVDSPCPDTDPDPDTEKPLPVVAELAAAEDPVVVGKQFWGPTRNVRLERGLVAPEVPPPKWNDFAVRRNRVGFSPHDVAAAHLAYVRDKDFQGKGWPIGIFLKPTVFGSRLKKLGPAPPPVEDPNDYARLAAAIADSQPELERRAS